MKKSLLIALLPMLPSCAPPPAAPPPQAPEAPAQPVSAAPAPEAAAPRAQAGEPAAETQAEPVAAVSAGLHSHALLQEQIGFYAVLTPPGYDDPANAKQKYPIVVLLPEAGATEAETARKADELGREGVLYVIPRAPYPNSDGYSARPQFPKAWGEPGSETYPQKDVEALDVPKLYTAQIAEALKDARKRYRAAWGKVTVYGEGEGATFAHTFATQQPWVVGAYFASGGNYDATTESKAGAAHAQALKTNKVSALLMHAEADPMAQASSAKKLDELLTKHRVDHELVLVQGSSPVLTKEQRDQAKRFVRHHCCGEPLVAPAPVETAATTAKPAAGPAPAAAPQSKPAGAAPAANPSPANPQPAPAAVPPAAKPAAPAKPANPAPAVAKAPTTKAPAAAPVKPAAPGAEKAAPAPRTEDKTAATAAPSKPADKPVAGKAAPAKDVPAKAIAPAKPEAANPAPAPAPAAPPSK